MNTKLNDFNFFKYARKKSLKYFRRQSLKYFRFIAYPRPNLN